MSARTFIDTLFVVALINQRDQHHQRAAELAESYEGRQYLITDALLLEIGNALARKYRRQAMQVIEHFLSSGDVEVVRLTPELFEQGKGGPVNGSQVGYVSAYRIMPSRAAAAHSACRKVPRRAVFVRSMLTPRWAP